MSDPQPSRIIAVIEAQRAALLARDTATLQRYVSQWRDVESAIRDSAELLANDIAASARAGNPVSQNKLYQLERYQALLQQTRTQIQEYARQLAPQIEAEQASLWQQGQLDANDQISAIVGTSFSRLPIEATNTMIGLTGDGSPLRNTLLSHWPNAVDAITRELLRGVAMGVNPRVTARRAAAASQASLRQMLSVARTESLRAYRESSRDLYNRSGVVKQYKRLAAKNARTCVLCLADDGTTYKVSEPLPIHVNCRCTSIPIIEGYNIETGKDGAEWFAAQSADTQRQMLGPSRYAMYKDGTPLSAFVNKHNDPVWGATLVKPSIDAIGKRGVQSLGSVARASIAGVHVDAALTARVQTMDNRIAQLRGDVDRAMTDGKFSELPALRAEIKQLKADVRLLREEARRPLYDHIYHRTPATFTAKPEFGYTITINPTLSDDIEDGINIFRRMIGLGKIDGATYSIKQEYTNAPSRAYANVLDERVVLYNSTSTRTTIHELAHLLEANPRYQRMANEFLDRRTQGENARKLSEITGNASYADSEIAKPDRFEDAYVGKIYANKNTEVISMGFEYMYADAESFAKNDPDYFDFIYGIMHGE